MSLVVTGVWRNLREEPFMQELFHYLQPTEQVQGPRAHMPPGHRGRQEFGNPLQDMAVDFPLFTRGCAGGRENFSQSRARGRPLMSSVTTSGKKLPVIIKEASVLLTGSNSMSIERPPDRPRPRPKTGSRSFVVLTGRPISNIMAF